MTDAVEDVAKATPPTAVISLDLAGIPLSDWILLLTAVYTLLMIVYQAVKIRQAMKGQPPLSLFTVGRGRRKSDCPECGE